MEMARNCGNEKWENSTSEEDEEEEEALSLCDLPVSLISEENQSRNEEAKAFKTEEDFDFGSWGGSLLTESEMCVADEVFFQGQILPLRLSVSSDSCSAGFRHDSRNPSRCNSRSQSMDHRCSGGFSSISSRSSSSRSHHSSSSTTTTTATTTTKYKPRVRNQFHTHPSPKPQIRVSSIRHGNIGGRSRNSTMWDFFRLGLVRTPEIELQYLKLRANNSNSSSRNSSCSSKHSKLNSSNDGDKSNHGPNMKKNKKQRFFTKDSAFLSGCKCSAGAVETVSSRIVIMKSGTGSSNNESETHAIKAKLQQLKKQKRQQHGKQAVSRHRTFEWLKELSLEGNLAEA